MVLGVGIDTEGNQGRAVIDTLSPITFLDPILADSDVGDIFRKRVTVTLHGNIEETTRTVARAQFGSINAYVDRPCELSGPCEISSRGTTIEALAAIGADVLSKTAIRFDFPIGQIRFFPDLAGTDAILTENCSAVFANPFAGGGTVRVSGSDVGFLGLRPAIGVCMDSEAPVETERHGVDGIFLISTATETSLMSATSYARFALATGAPPLESLSQSTHSLYGGTLTGGLATIGSLAFVGEQSDRRGPCEELFANRVMSVDGCNGDDPVTPCPCIDNKLFCRTAAAIELDVPLQFLVIDDKTPFLQALRDEVNPALPEVDGIIGTNALQLLRFQIDYPNGRIVSSCFDDSSAGTCATRPQVRSRNSLGALAVCNGAP